MGKPSAKPILRIMRADLSSVYMAFLNSAWNRTLFRLWSWGNILFSGKLSVIFFENSLFKKYVVLSMPLLFPVVVPYHNISSGSG